ncbi:hypothetical protein NCC49_005654 [Naganishia albida]|nr:hypothetical protein NCC49_005654 [Naganishia albida]
MTNTAAGPPALQPHAVPRAVHYDHTFNANSTTAAAGTQPAANAAPPPLEQLSSLEQMRELLAIMREMKYEMQDVRRELGEVKEDKSSRITQAAERVRSEMAPTNMQDGKLRETMSLRDLSFHTKSAVSSNADNIVTQRSQLKASDVPKFSGAPGQDIDVWISQITAMFSYGGRTGADLLQMLALILVDRAGVWFSGLGDRKRQELNTWAACKAKLRKAYRGLNHASIYRTMLWKRTLAPNEFFVEYFDDRRALQRFLYGDDAAEKEYIDDMLSGIPVKFHPTIKAEIRPGDDIDDLRRIFIDQEPGLQPHMYQCAPSSFVHPVDLASVSRFFDRSHPGS